MQDYKAGVRYKLGAKKTSQILYLSIANVTYVPQNPLFSNLRSREVHIVDEETAGCKSDDEGRCLVSVSILSRYPFPIASPLSFSQRTQTRFLIYLVIHQFHVEDGLFMHDGLHRCMLPD